MLRRFHPMRLVHQPTGIAVLVDHGGSLDEMRALGREYLAARVAASRRT